MSIETLNIFVDMVNGKNFRTKAQCINWLERQAISTWHQDGWKTIYLNNGITATIRDGNKIRLDGRRCTKFLTFPK